MNSKSITDSKIHQNLLSEMSSNLTDFSNEIKGVSLADLKDLINQRATSDKKPRREDMAALNIVIEELVSKGEDKESLQKVYTEVKRMRINGKKIAKDLSNKYGFDLEG